MAITTLALYNIRIGLSRVIVLRRRFTGLNYRHDGEPIVTYIFEEYEQDYLVGHPHGGASTVSRFMSRNCDHIPG